MIVTDSLALCCGDVSRHGPSLMTAEMLQGGIIMQHFAVTIGFCAIYWLAQI
jgi:hypothetical protein